MPSPEGVFGLAVLFVLALPGVLWASVRSRLTGFSMHDRDVSSRILEALIVSTVFDSIYVILFGDWLVQQIHDAAHGALESPRPVGVVVLGLGAALPATLAYLRYTYRLERRPDPSGLRRWRLVHLRAG